MIKNDNLAIILPEGDVIELVEPDKKGRWFFKGSASVAVSFNKDELSITSLNIIQTFR